MCCARTRGQILYNGRNVHDVGDEYKAEIGYLPQLEERAARKIWRKSTKARRKRIPHVTACFL